MKKFKKPIGIILAVFLLVTMIFPINAFAALTGYVVKEDDGTFVQFDAEALINDYLFGEREMFDRYNAGELVALYDDVGGYIDIEDVYQLMVDGEPGNEIVAKMETPGELTPWGDETVVPIGEDGEEGTPIDVPPSGQLPDEDDEDPAIVSINAIVDTDGTTVIATAAFENLDGEDALFELFNADAQGEAIGGALDTETVEIADDEAVANFAGLTPGDYLVTVTVDTLTDATTVTVPDPGPGDEDTFTVSGTVTDGTDAIVGATVTLTDNIGTETFDPETTDAAGAYEFAEVPAGEYTLTVTADGYEAAAPVDVEVIDEDVVVLEVVLVAEDDDDDEIDTTELETLVDEIEEMLDNETLVEAAAANTVPKDKFFLTPTDMEDLEEALVEANALLDDEDGDVTQDDIDLAYETLNDLYEKKAQGEQLVIVRLTDRVSGSNHIFAIELDDIAELDDTSFMVTVDDVPKTYEAARPGIANVTTGFYQIKDVTEAGADVSTYEIKMLGSDINPGDVVSISLNPPHDTTAVTYVSVEVETVYTQRVSSEKIKVIFTTTQTGTVHFAVSSAAPAPSTVTEIKELDGAGFKTVNTIGQNEFEIDGLSAGAHTVYYGMETTAGVFSAPVTELISAVSQQAIPNGTYKLATDANGNNASATIAVGTDNWIHHNAGTITYQVGAATKVPINVSGIANQSKIVALIGSDGAAGKLLADNGDTITISDGLVTAVSIGLKDSGTAVNTDLESNVTADATVTLSNSDSSTNGKLTFDADSVGDVIITGSASTNGIDISAAVINGSITVTGGTASVITTKNDSSQEIVLSGTATAVVGGVTIAGTGTSINMTAAGAATITGGTNSTASIAASSAVLNLTVEETFTSIINASTANFASLINNGTIALYNITGVTANANGETVSGDGTITSLTINGAINKVLNLKSGVGTLTLSQAFGTTGNVTINSQVDSIVVNTKGTSETDTITIGDGGGVGSLTISGAQSINHIKVIGTGELETVINGGTVTKFTILRNPASNGEFTTELQGDKVAQLDITGPTTGTGTQAVTGVSPTRTDILEGRIDLSGLNGAIGRIDQGTLTGTKIIRLTSGANSLSVGTTDSSANGTMYITSTDGGKITVASTKKAIINDLEVTCTSTGTGATYELVDGDVLIKAETDTTAIEIDATRITKDINVAFDNTVNVNYTITGHPTYKVTLYDMVAASSSCTVTGGVVDVSNLLLNKSGDAIIITAATNATVTAKNTQDVKVNNSTGGTNITLNTANDLNVAGLDKASTVTVTGTIANDLKGIAGTGTVTVAAVGNDVLAPTGECTLILTGDITGALGIGTDAKEIKITNSIIIGGAVTTNTSKLKILADTTFSTTVAITNNDEIVGGTVSGVTISFTHVTAASGTGSGNTSNFYGTDGTTKAVVSTGSYDWVYDDIAGTGKWVRNA